jgi:hypothetical protein
MHSGHRLAAATLGIVAVIAATGLVGIASARIVVGQRIAGVTIGETQAKVVRAIGQPNSRDVCPGCGAGAGVRNGVLFSYKRRKLEVLFIGKAVAEVSTTSSAQRTGAGIGPGSTLSEVQARYGRCVQFGVQCFISHYPRHTGDLYLGVELTPNHRVFRIAVGRYDARATGACYLSGCG